MERHALVTGGAQGIGRATAELLAARRWTVTAADVDEAALAGALLRAGGVCGQIIVCDRGDNLRMNRARQRRNALPDRP